MSAIADLSEYVNRMSGGNSGTPDMPPVFIASRLVSFGIPTAPIAARWSSLWQYVKHPGGAGAVPGTTPRNPTNATNGSLFQADPGSGRQKWLIGGYASCFVPGTLLVYDRLGDVSGFSGTNTSTQSVSGGSLSVSRYTGTESVGNAIMVEIYTQVGASTTTIFATYTNQDGTGSRQTDTVNFGATGFREAQRLIMLPLQAGDTGVRSVESVKLAATTATVGDFGITIMRPLTMFASQSAGMVVPIALPVDPPGIAEIKSGACIAFAWYPNTTTTPEVFAQLSMIER